MKTEEPPATNTPEKTRATWMLLPFRLVFRVLAAVLFLCYVLIGMASTIDLYTRDMYRAQDIGTLYTVINDALQPGGKLKNVTVWLRARPLAETDRLMEMITPKSAPLEPGTFFEIFRRQLQRGRTQEALFWLQLGRYRLRYDIVRCGAEPAAIKAFDPILNLLPPPAIDDLLRAHPELLKKTLQQVLDFDAKYPAHDDPAAICKTISVEPPVDDFNWEGYHQMMRKRTEEFLHSPEAAAKAQ